MERNKSKTSYKQGFTLIELLVVILIIGILAAVAVPQYQKAVEKSRAAEAITLLKAMVQAQQVYYLANGNYADSFNELDLDIPFTGEEVSGSAAWADYGAIKDWIVFIEKSNNYRAVGLRRRSNPYIVAWYFTRDEGNTRPLQVMVCMENGEADYCQKYLNGSFAVEVSGYRWYLI